MDCKLSDYARKYYLSRIRQIENLRISADHKLEKLEQITKAELYFRKGMITESELLWMIA